MTIQVTGKNIEVGEAFQSFVAEKISAALEKYIGPELSARVRVQKERGRFHTGCTVVLKTGLVLESEGDGADAYASADAAIERLEKRLRRYKRRLKGHNNHGHAAEAASDTVGVDYVVELPEDEAADVADGANGASATDAPVIIAETTLAIRELPVSAAVLQLDLTEAPVLVFRNAASGEINVVYKRRDGNIGWIDPKMTAQSGGTGQS